MEAKYRHILKRTRKWNGSQQARVAQRVYLEDDDDDDGAGAVVGGPEEPATGGAVMCCCAMLRHYSVPHAHTTPDRTADTSPLGAHVTTRHSATSTRPSREGARASSARLDRTCLPLGIMWWTSFKAVLRKNFILKVLFFFFSLHDSPHGYLLCLQLRAKRLSVRS